MSRSVTLSIAAILLALASLAITLVRALTSSP